LPSDETGNEQLFGAPSRAGEMCQMSIEQAVKLTTQSIARNVETSEIEHIL